MLEVRLARVEDGVRVLGGDGVGDEVAAVARLARPQPRAVRGGPVRVTHACA